MTRDNLAEEALAVSQQLEPAAAEAWKNYGILADIIEKEARTHSDGEQRSALERQARRYRELQRQAPIVSATLAQVGELPSFGRAVILGQLARCFHMGGRPDLAVRHDQEAVSITTTLKPSDGVKSLLVTLYLDLGDVLRAAGHDPGAGRRMKRRSSSPGNCRTSWDRRRPGNGSAAYYNPFRRADLGRNHGSATTARTSTSRLTTK